MSLLLILPLIRLKKRIMTFDWITPFIAGPVIGIASLLLAYAGYRRSTKADAVAKEVSIKTAEVAKEAQEIAARTLVYDSYGDLLENQRKEIIFLRSEIAELKKENAELRVELRQLKNGK